MSHLSDKILICEDEKNIVSFLTVELDHAGFAADVAYDGVTAIELFAGRDYQLVLLDLMLPLKNGLEVLRTIRKTSDVPVIILTARKDTFDKVLLLNSGADDYITKPFDTMELLARIGRNIERNHKSRSVRVRGLHIDSESFVCRVDGKELQLTKTEFEILFALCQNADRVLSRSQIAERLYGEYLGDSNVVDVNVKNIRHKLAQISEYVFIETVRGKGYVVRS